MVLNDNLRKSKEIQLRNLRPAVKGEPSRNPEGRPKKADSLISCIKEELAKVSINGMSTNEQLIAGILVGKATTGDMKALDILMEYTVVKPKTVIGGDSDSPLIFRVIEATPTSGTV